MIFEVDERRVGVEVVARREADELVVVGLANFGVRLFTLRQRGREISIADTPSREQRHLALWVLDALHRVRWIRPPGGAGREAESLRWDWYGERVTEQH